MSIVAFNNILFNRQTIAAMHPSAERLYKAAQDLANTTGQSAVARLLNESPQTVKNWESRGVSKAGAIKAQEVIGCSATWITTGTGPTHTSAAQTPAAPPTLEQALAVVARCLNDLPDSAREQAAQHLQTLARAPDSKKALAALRQAMTGATDLSSTPTAQHLLSADASIESAALPRPALPKP